MDFLKRNFGSIVSLLLLFGSLVAMCFFVPHWSTKEFWMSVAPAALFLALLVSIRNWILRLILIDGFFLIAGASFFAREVYKYVSKDMILATVGVNFEVSVGVLETAEPIYLAAFAGFMLLISVLAYFAYVSVPGWLKFYIMPLPLLGSLMEPARETLDDWGYRNFVINNEYSPTFMAQDYLDMYKIFWGDTLASAMVGLEQFSDRLKYTVTPHAKVPDFVKPGGNGEDKIVLVIGESSNVKRYSLYGYGQPTTPNLDKMQKDGAICHVEKVHSATPTTRTSVPTYVSMSTPEDRDALFNYQNIIEMAKNSGYKTYWIGTQRLDTLWDKTYGFVAKYSDVLVSPDHNNGVEVRDTKDDDLLAPIHTYFSSAPQKSFFIIHIYGSHLPYKRNVDDADRFSLPDADMYDKSIHHTDRTLKMIMDEADKSLGLYKFVYLPDHGEAVDKGHGFISKLNEMYLIPLIANDAASCSAMDTLRGDDGYVRSDAVKYLVLSWLGYRVDAVALDDAKRNSHNVMTGDERMLDFRNLADCTGTDCTD